MLVEPLHGLEKGLLLGESLNLDIRVATNSEAMLNTGEEVDLEGLAGLDEDLLRSVSLLGGEDAVSLSGGNGQRASDGSELLLLDE